MRNVGFGKKISKRGSDFGSESVRTYVSHLTLVKDRVSNIKKSF